MWLGRLRRRGRGRRGRRPAPFVVGVGRSGTTLLRLMLDAHPQLAIPPETHFIPKLQRAMREGLDTPRGAVEFLATRRRWGDFGLEAAELEARVEAAGELTPTSVTRAFFDLYAESQGKPRWGDKTPPYVARMPRVESVVPEARFIHLIRDGRAVSLSLTRAHFGPDTVADAAELWARRVQRARRASERLSHYLEIRYEALVRDPEAALRRICEFAEIDFAPAMLDHHERAAQRMAEQARAMPRADGADVSADMRARLHHGAEEPVTSERAEGWRDELSAEDLNEIGRIAGPALAELGYVD